MDLYQRQRYFAQQDAITSLYAFHAEEFDQVPKEGMDAFDAYYFLRRPIDVEDIADYAAKLAKTDPAIVIRAERALEKVLKYFRLDERHIADLLPTQQ